MTDPADPMLAMLPQIHDPARYAGAHARV